MWLVNKEVQSMKCPRCGKSIPDRAFQCPYCNKRTKKGWQHEGEKIVAPLTNMIKKITRK